MSLQKKLKNDLGEIFGYVRVSTAQQHEDRQLIALEEYGVDPAKIFTDKQSGKNFNRPAYKKLIQVVRRGDIIVIKSLDRLGRNYQDIIDQWRMITQDIGCGIHIIDTPLLNTNGNPDDLLNKFITDLMLQVLSFVAQNEREQTIARQKEGIAAAKRRRNIKIGRPKKKMPFDFWEIFVLWKTKEYRSNDLWRFCHETWGMSNRTFYRRIHELDQRYGDFPPERLRDLILDDDFVNGIEFDNERIEKCLGYYNPYVLNDPTKAEKERMRRKKKEAEFEELDEAEIKRIMLRKRQEDFKKRFGIIEISQLEKKLAENTVDEETSETETDTDNIPPKKSSFQHIANNHKKNSGIEEAISLEDDQSPIIPNIEPRTENSATSRTIIIT